MDLSIYDVIRRPYLSTKARALGQKERKLVLEVHPQANKTMIKQALKKLFNINATKVAVIVSQGKMRRSGRNYVQDALSKKAIITVKQESLEQVSSLNAAASMPTEGV